jgi:hypothetical protein
MADAKRADCEQHDIDGGKGEIIGDDDDVEHLDDRPDDADDPLPMSPLGPVAAVHQTANRHLRAFHSKKYELSENHTS